VVLKDETAKDLDLPATILKKILSLSSLAAESHPWEEQPSPAALMQAMN
jgi:hypothetical protein